MMLIKRKSILLLTALFLMCCAAGLWSGLIPARAAETTTVNLDEIAANGDRAFVKGNDAGGVASYTEGQFTIQGVDCARVYYNTQLTDFDVTMTLTPDFAENQGSGFVVGLRNKLNNTTPTAGNQTGYFLEITATTIKLRMAGSWEFVGEGGTVDLKNGTSYLFRITMTNNDEGNVDVKVWVNGSEVLSVTDSSETKVTTAGYIGFSSLVPGEGKLLIGKKQEPVEKPELTEVNLDEKAQTRENFTEFAYAPADGSVSWSYGQFTVRGQNAAGLYYNETLLNASVSMTAEFGFQNNWHAFAVRATSAANAPTGGGVDCYFFMVNKTGVTVYYSKGGAFPEENNLGSGTFAAPLEENTPYSIRLETYNAENGVHLAFYLGDTKVVEAVDDQNRLKDAGLVGVGTYSNADAVKIGVYNEPDDPFEGLTQTDMNQKTGDASNFITPIGKLQATNGQISFGGIETTGYYKETVPAGYVTVDARFDFSNGNGGLFALRASNTNGAAYYQNKDAYLFAFTRDKIILHRAANGSFQDTIAQNSFEFSTDNAVRLDFVNKNVENGVYLAVYVDGVKAFEYTDTKNPITEDGYFGFMTQTQSACVIGKADAGTQGVPGLIFEGSIDDKLISDSFFQTFGTGVSYAKRQYTMKANEDTIYYTEKKLRDTSLAMTLEFDKLDRIGFVLRGTAATGAGYAQNKSAYVILVTEHQIQLYRNIEGVQMGQPIQTADFTAPEGTKWNVAVSSWNASDGVHIVLSIGDTAVFSYVDTSAEALTEGGYFGVSNFSASAKLTVGVYTEEQPVEIPDDLGTVSVDTRLVTKDGWTEFDSEGAGVNFEYADGYYSLSGVEATLYYDEVLPADTRINVTVTKKAMADGERFGLGARLSNRNVSLWTLNKNGYYFEFKGSDVSLYKIGSKMDLLATGSYTFDDQPHEVSILTMNIEHNQAAYLLLTIDGEKVIEYKDFANPILEGGSFGVMTNGAGTTVTIGSGKKPLPTASNEFEGGRLLANGGKTMGAGTTVSDGSILFSADNASLFYSDAKFVNTGLRFSVTPNLAQEQWFGITVRRSEAEGAMKNGYVFRIYANRAQLVKVKDGTETVLATAEGIGLRSGAENSLVVLDLQETESVRLVLIVNDVEVLTFTDSEQAILEAGYMGMTASTANTVSLSAAGYDPEVEDFYLNDLLQNRDNWYGLERMPSFPEGGIRVSGNDAVAGCNNVPMGNFRLHLSYVVPELVGGQWNAMFFRTDRAGEAAFNGNNGYLLFMTASSVNLVRYTNSGRTETSLTSVQTTAFATPGDLVELQLFVKDEANGVHIRLLADGMTLLDYVDTADERIEGEGLFNIFAFGGGTAEFRGTQGYVTQQPLIDSNPNTSDSRPIALAAIVLVAALGGLVLTFLLPRKKDHKQ